LSRIERAPTTVRAYAHDLKTFWEFVEARGIEWDRVSLEQLGEFTAWLRQPADNVVVLATGRPARASSTVNRILTAVFGFYEFHARHGVEVARALVDERRMGRGNFKPFLHGIAPSRPRGRVGRLCEERRLPATLTVEQVAAILAAQTRLRDRFLFALLAGTGMRIGQALGLRHCDVVSHERRIEVVPREDNANGARGKRGRGWVPITSELVRLHSDYMHVEYGDLDSDYVFVSLWSGRIGRPLTYASVYDLVCRLRKQTGIMFGPHTFRHSYATGLLRRGVAVEVVQHLLGHASIATTGDAYAHLKVEDARRALVASGWLTDQDGPP
jgi:integrase/recombinase XerD